MKAKNPIASLFGTSPFKAMQQHMGVVNDCVGEVPVLFDALIAGDKAGVERAKEAIFEKEQEADMLKNEIRIHLPKSLFMPVDRRDLLDVLAMQDAIADTAQDIAGLLVERDMTVPADMVDTLRTFVQRCVDACVESKRVTNELDELVETGFRGREANTVEEMVNKINAIEDETDKLGVELSRALFKQEDSLGAVSVIFWYQLLQWIGDLADYAEKVGDRLRLLIAR